MTIKKLNISLKENIGLIIRTKNKSKTICCLIFLILTFLVINSLVNSLDVTFSKTVCDPNEFFEPYVRVSKTRKGAIIKGIYETGFIDLRNYTGLLCINGPAFVYSEMVGKKFAKADVQVFSHGCFGFNRRDIQAYKNPLPTLQSSTKVYNAKVFGVYLLGETADYRRSQFQWFQDPEFGFDQNESSSDVISGSSFGMVVTDGGKSGSEVIETPPGPTAYCFHVDSEKISGKISAAIKTGDGPKFCYRAEENAEEDFDAFFHKNLQASDYNFTDPDAECMGSGGDGDLDDSTPKPMPDFRIIDPDLLKSMGSPGKAWSPKVVSKSSGNIPFYSRPHPPGYYFKGEPGYVEPVTESVTDEVTVTTTEKPQTRASAEAKDCEELPALGTCDEEFDEETACDILKHTLTIEKTDWDSAKLMPGKWRLDVLNLINRIYVKVCPQVSKGLAPAVTRVVEYFIYKISENAETKEAGGDPTTTGEKKWKSLNTAARNEWTGHLIPDLERCLKNADKMPFYRTRDLESEKKKKEVEATLDDLAHGRNGSGGSGDSTKKLDDTLKDVHIMFPYFIWLPPPPNWDNHTQIQVKEHVEAAEIDYDLDWVIDTFWKVFSTVAGYCNLHYRLRDGATFKTLYSYYTEDILELVSEQWIHEAIESDGKTYILGNFEKVYDQIFGEFINGVAARYIDACNDGAYWWADVPDFRPPRPVFIKAGSIKPGSNHPVNFFTQHPLFHQDPKRFGRRRK